VQGLVPCAFCLLERWPYRALLLLGLARVVPMRPAFARVVFWLAILSLLAAAGLALVHVGVERHWWPDPIPSCAAPVFHGGSLRERLASMPLRPAKPCDAANRLFGWLPVSMATLNLLFALGLLAVLPLLAWPPGMRRSGRRPV
jgi:disulfide bond formation protein DsbB